MIPFSQTKKLKQGALPAETKARRLLTSFLSYFFFCHNLLSLKNTEFIYILLWEVSPYSVCILVSQSNGKVLCINPRMVNTAHTKTCTSLL